MAAAKKINKQLWRELQDHLDACYPNSQIEQQNSLGSRINLRFELGEGFPNGSINRVNQATERATLLFEDTFPDPNTQLLVLIYEYPNQNPQANFFNTDHQYLYTLFSDSVAFSTYWRRLQDMDKLFKIAIGKLRVADMQIRNILNGIAKSEMGYSPSVDQSLFFFSPSTQRAFYMYDDRGCSIWSDAVAKIRDIFFQRNDWIVDYHRTQIEEQFFNS